MTKNEMLKILEKYWWGYNNFPINEEAIAGWAKMLEMEKPAMVERAFDAVCYRPGRDRFPRYGEIQAELQIMRKNKPQIDRIVQDERPYTPEEKEAVSAQMRAKIATFNNKMLKDVVEKLGRKMGFNV